MGVPRIFTFQRGVFQHVEKGGVYGSSSHPHFPVGGVVQHVEPGVYRILSYDTLP